MRWGRHPTFRIRFENQDFPGLYDYQYSYGHPSYYGHNFEYTNNLDFSGYPGYPNDHFSYPYSWFT
ncbi:hypothetical protein ALC53_03242 [Atta colombica]|uniref:Uncharacterized protein n=1 Tax=Atta colombica TaxID=520822 RepID=A0A195BNK7_9HYME|nr:hypothetical protein ALC53_03242 [Atta colombica]